MVASGTLQHDTQQMEVAARLDALLAQLHGYRDAVSSYRDGVQHYKVWMSAASTCSMLIKSGCMNHHVDHHAVRRIFALQANARHSSRTHADDAADRKSSML